MQMDARLQLQHKLEQLAVPIRDSAGKSASALSQRRMWPRQVLLSGAGAGTGIESRPSQQITCTDWKAEGVQQGRRGSWSFAMIWSRAGNKFVECALKCFHIGVGNGAREEEGVGGRRSPCPATLSSVFLCCLDWKLVIGARNWDSRQD